MVKIVEPKVEIIGDINGTEILKHIELCARNCYKSEGNITEDISSAEKMIKKLIELDHTAMLEHSSITVKMLTDVGSYKDLTRHRHASFAIESTRYCNYSKGKFGNELTVINPCNIKPDTAIYHTWLKTMNDIEKAYMDMSEFKALPDQMRMILPHSLAASVVMSANIREWRYVFNLRCAKAAHPTVRQIMLMTMNEFHTLIPILFDDIFDKYFDDIIEMQAIQKTVRLNLKDKSSEERALILQKIEEYKNNHNDITIIEE